MAIKRGYSLLVLFRANLDTECIPYKRPGLRDSQPHPDGYNFFCVFIRYPYPLGGVANSSFMDMSKGRISSEREKREYVSHFEPFGKLLILGRAFIVALGLLLTFWNRIPFLGKLPGDIFLQKDNFQFFFPIVTCMVISVVLTIIINLIIKLL